MSPVRDPNARSIRRMAKSVAVAKQQAEQRTDAAASPPASPGRSSPAADEPPLPNDLERWDDEELDAVPLRQKHSGRRSERSRRHFEKLSTAPLPPDGSALEAPVTVVGTARGPCEVELPDGSVVLAHLPKALARDEKSEIAVGDRVLLARRASGELVVDRLLPRTSRLSRPDPFLAHRERVLAANLDLAVVVTSLRRPPLSTGLLDRFLVALAYGDVPATIAVNKADLLEGGAEDPELARLEPYRRLGVPLFLCSAKTGAGLAELGAAIAGKTVAFVGHSGVGKSSILNALLPDAKAAVAEVSAAHDRGRHTTTRSRIYRSGTTRFVDTPGVREFGLWKMTPRELASYFDDFAAAPPCRFGDCSHRHEPSCGVRAAVEAGSVARDRYETYLRVLGSLEES